ncbi:cilia and flagella-associated protein 47 isoform X2 [Osmia lignaria lignaria]|uniref:cilia and flagella-associated protein 47 isoform X2 n=1 Tax=Osmia lignaria lignaria TaxID=1437193 RepID=UPI00402B972F
MSNTLGGTENQLSTSIILIQEGVEVSSVRDSNDAVPSAVHDNVHITPSYIEFKEASEGITCRQLITIKNTGLKPAFVKLRQPYSIAFQVKILKNGVMLNPGLSVSTTVIYSFKRPSFLRAMIPIEINGKSLDYRVVCKLLEEGISVEPKTIDFGILDIGYSSGIKVLTMRNDGGKSTRFSIDLGKNDLEIAVKPLRGVVTPNRPVQLTVELIGMQEGVFYSEFWIKSSPNIRIPLKVNVIAPKLVVYHPNTTGDFTLIDFSIAVANTRKYDSFVLRNVSSQVASYVVLGEIENEVKCIRDIDREKYPVYNAFEIRPIQGRMDPMEGIIFEVGFTPTTKLLRWRQKVKEKTDRPENDFMAFLRIVRVHVTETKNIPRSDAMREALVNESGTPSSHDVNAGLTVMNISTSSSSSSTIMERGVHDTIRLCLHGEVEEACLKFEPDIVYFGEISVDEISQRVVRILNPLKFAPILYRFVPNTAVRCYPKRMEIKAEGSIEVLLKMRGKENVFSPFKIYFDAIVDSYESTKTRNKIKLKVGTYPVQCVVSIILLTKNLQEPHDHSRGIRKPLLPQFLDTMKSQVPEEPDREILDRLLRLPKWKYEDMFKTVKCNSGLDKKEVLPSSINTEVLIPLSPLQIYNVRVYPSIFTFGMVVLKSHSYRQLIVENMNDFPVMIRLTSLSRCIFFPDGNVIILPAGALVTRLVEFRAHHIGKFNGYIDYIINDNHSFELGVIADIVRKQLSLETREATLGTEWLKEEVYRPLDITLQIRNKLNAKTYFRWEVPATCGFFIEPVSGAIRGNSSLFCYAYYKPHAIRSHNTEMTLKCEGGTFLTVRLNVPIQLPKVSFIEDTINVGKIPLNLPTETIALLSNVDYVEAAYEVDVSSLMYGCSVYPLTGIIMPRGMVGLEITLTFCTCFDFVIVIRVTIQGCLHLQLKIMGNVTFPQLKLYPQSISLRRISAAAYQHFLITATNVGTTMLKLNFLLQDYPEFRISLSPDRTDPGLGMGNVFIMAGTSRSLHLHFEPIDLASYAFYLPIVINDILGPALETDPRTLKPLEYLKPFKKYYVNLTKDDQQDIPLKLVTISIDCTVAGHVVHFSKLEFRFNISTNEVEEFCIENRREAKEKSIRIETNNFSVPDCPFSIQWSDGKEATITTDSIECTLKQGEKCVFLIAFHPKSSGNFNLEAPIFVNNELDGEMFNKLSLNGEYPVRSIGASISEIYFTPVPLDVAIERGLRLIVTNFENESTIFAKVSTPDCCTGIFKQEMLSINFINGNSIPASEYTQLEVKIVFKSDTSVSFRLIIEFSDDSGLAVCPVMIYATADNCLLTTHVYLRTPKSDFEWFADQDKRISHISKLSDTMTDDEEYENDGQASYSARHRQTSGPRISILSYIEQYSEGSVKKLLESRFKLSLNKSVFMEMNEQDAYYKSEEDPKKFHLESRRSSKISSFYYKKYFEQLEYPFFPSNNERDDYELHMQQTLVAAEEWLYTGPFKFNFYPEVPNGITVSMSKFYPKKQAQLKSKSQKRRSFEWSFLNVLELLSDQTLYNYIEKPKTLPDDEVERAHFLFHHFESILNYLLLSGAHVCHVSAQFLLSYDDYVIVTENIKSMKKVRRSSITIWTGTEKLSPRLFESRSKQCWLDVILQTYKCFVLTSISQIKVRKESFSVSTPPSRRSTVHRASVITSSLLNLPKQCEIHDRNIRDMVDLSGDRKSRTNCYSCQEIFLMAWLEYHYEQERTKEWMTDRRLILNPNESKDVAEARSIRNFDADLADSLVLAAVTAAHCPFLIEECFNSIYFYPQNFEEILHNAVCVVNAWRKIRLGFVISPLEIVYPNCIKMLLLVIYLYKTLPTYIPKTKIKFSCALCEVATKQINFSNPTADNVGFLILLFGNSNGFFMTETPKPIIRLGAHESAVVKLKFHAKKIKKTKAHLLFCGSTIGPHFGRNQVFVLEGQADTLGIANEYMINSKLYEVIDKILSINVPYKDPADYEIWMSDERPSKPSALKLTRWADLRSRKIPRRLFLNQTFITVKEGSNHGSLSLTLACIMPIDRDFWIVFQSKMGDFIIQISSRCKPSIIDNLIITLSLQEDQCTCTDTYTDFSKSCPFSLMVPIPCKNKQLWSSVAYMFQKALDQQERIFWSRYLGQLLIT